MVFAHNNIVCFIQLLLLSFCATASDNEDNWDANVHSHLAEGPRFLVDHADVFSDIVNTINFYGAHWALHQLFKSVPVFTSKYTILNPFGYI